MENKLNILHKMELGLSQQDKLIYQLIYHLSEDHESNKIEARKGFKGSWLNLNLLVTLITNVCLFINICLFTFSVAM